MTRFEALKFLHVLGAIVWIGAGLSLFTYSVRIRSEGDEAGFGSLARHATFLTNTLFVPASLATLVFGILMVVTEPRFGFGDLWIVMGLVGIGASMVIGFGLLAPLDKKLTALFTEHGFQHAEVETLTGRLLRWNAIDLGILVTVAWAMVAKPGG